MKHIKLFMVLFLILGLAWGCNKKSSVTPESALETTGADSEVSGLSKQGHVVEFEVKFQNLSPATGPGASQPMSPPVFATHAPAFHMFQVRRHATTEMRQIAEDAVNGPMLDKLDNAVRVFDYQQGGLVLPRHSATYKIKAKIAGFGFFSLVSMLVNTNDGFTGVDALRLPREKAVYYLYAYDAGTEKNTEMKAHIPGPCCGSPLVRVPTHQRIKRHKGILGVADLDPEMYGWDEPVAKLTITPIGLVE